MKEQAQWPWTACFWLKYPEWNTHIGFGFDGSVLSRIQTAVDLSTQHYRRFMVPDRLGNFIET